MSGARGAVLDCDARELLIFGGEDVLFDLYLRAVWQRLIAPLWAEWTVRWAARGILDLATKVGMPREAVLARRPPEFKAPNLLPTTLETGLCHLGDCGWTGSSLHPGDLRGGCAAGGTRPAPRLEEA